MERHVLAGPRTARAAAWHRLCRHSDPARGPSIASTTHLIGRGRPGRKALSLAKTQDIVTHYEGLLRDNGLADKYGRSMEMRV